MIVASILRTCIKTSVIHNPSAATSDDLLAYDGFPNSTRTHASEPKYVRFSACNLADKLQQLQTENHAREYRVGKEHGIYLASTSWKRRGGNASAALSGGGAGVRWLVYTVARLGFCGYYSRRPLFLF